VLIEGHFERFLENLNPKMLSAIVWTQKGTSLRHNRCFELLCVRIHPRMTSVGESGKKRRGFIFHVFCQTLPYGRLAQILGYVFVSWTYSICAKFYRNRLRGLDSVSKFDHSHWIAMSPLTLLGTNVPAVIGHTMQLMYAFPLVSFRFIKLEIPLVSHLLYGNSFTNLFDGHLFFFSVFF